MDAEIKTLICDLEDRVGLDCAKKAASVLRAVFDHENQPSQFGTELTGTATNKRGNNHDDYDGHTPGPWTFVEHIEAALRFGVLDAWEVGNSDRKTGVAIVLGWKPNAQFISAAPDMYEALKGLISRATPETINRAIDAIKKAELR